LKGKNLFKKESTKLSFSLIQEPMKCAVGILAGNPVKKLVKNIPDTG
jgi:hypothetical protein